MRKRYEKQHAPAWQRKLTLLVSAFFAATLLLFCVWAIVLFLEPG